MQDRAYEEVLIDNVTHPYGGRVELAVGPDGRIYITYSYTSEYDRVTDTTRNRQGGWVEVYSAEGALLATIDHSYASHIDNDSQYFLPEVVLPGPDGIFSVFEAQNQSIIVIDSNFQTYRIVTSIDNIDNFFPR